LTLSPSSEPRPVRVQPLLVLSLAGLVLLAAPRAAVAWGEPVHRAVTGRAIDTLPKGLKPFYKAHRYEMPALSVEPAPTEEEGPERRFAVDRLLPFPFTDLPRSEEALKSRFGVTATQVGRLPWLIQQAYGRLVEAFRSRDKTRILTESDLLAGLVTDLHNPLALTENADGQKTGQHGLWIRFSLKLPEAMGSDLKLDPDAAHFLDDPQEYVFGMINATYVWLDNVLYQEELAKRGQAGYGELYYEALGGRAGPLLRERLSHAAADVGSYWYTAWTASGRPDLK